MRELPENIVVLGDPHLGRAFLNNVPLARRGDREKMVWNQFSDHLMWLDEKTKFHVNLGDIFDGPIMSYDTILKAARIYTAACERLPMTTFFILRGNHDQLKDVTRASAFDMFSCLVEGVTNLIIVSDECFTTGGMLFVGYDVRKTAAEMVEDVTAIGLKYAFGHWDVEDFGSGHNLIPTKELADLGVRLAITGHDHKRRAFTRDGVDVQVWGSMQPYAHGQEANDDLYVTLTVAEARERNDLHDKFVRIILEKGEEIDFDIDCLQLIKKFEGGDEIAPEPEVSLGDFDLNVVFSEVFADKGVPNEYLDKVLDEYQRRRFLG